MVLNAIDPSEAVLIYQVGTTKFINVGTIFSAYFQSLPVNSVAPACNEIQWEAYTD
jgi:hypothetical protein